MCENDQPNDEPAHHPELDYRTPEQQETESLNQRVMDLAGRMGGDSPFVRNSGPQASEGASSAVMLIDQKNALNRRYEMPPGLND